MNKDELQKNGQHDQKSTKEEKDQMRNTSPEDQLTKENFEDDHFMHDNESF